MIITNPNRTVQLIKELVDVWDASVKATHTFIEDKDRISLRPFVDPVCIGQGIGKMLITKAIYEYGILYVDVNEQNPNAANFYKRAGFVVFERKELDDMGNPFPILKMRLYI